MWTLDEFELGQKLGEGAFGKIYLAKRGRAIVALKILRKAQISRQKAQKLVEREIEVQSNLHHENLLSLYAYFWDDQSIFLVLEHSHFGDLRKLILQNAAGADASGGAAPLISKQDIKLYFKHTISGLQHLHKNEILFRDLKSENLLLFHPKIVKLSDFGAAVHGPKEFQADKRKTMIGNPLFYAPEMITDDAYDFFVDMWAAGLLLFELLFHGKLPSSPEFSPSSTSGDGARAAAGGNSVELPPDTSRNDRRGSEIVDRTGNKQKFAEHDQLAIFRDILKLDVKNVLSKAAQSTVTSAATGRDQMPSSTSGAGTKNYRGQEQSSWFRDEIETNAEDLISKLLVSPANKRLTCAQCLTHALLA
ncbi:unnamed protein product [Amoebophrya sp. A120]|nr:unnamed protein product [Amoebophrya sp. A120]|eukprot:GSA120T00006017001.1